ncbi:hypothetical protein SNOG_09317 [Parastagonospora nodorum SN15]|uniref:Fork-head domain-containing protein n=1 Tax=Phaeosphaeria nodorum (strain SN15 / ATCC MYA-4574 / FGSC 10173) TaxID=321614 RepID=Q0UFZ7_PHANO|nr:hypothetical protein SNOG_09317 [Parastagonospora nodorum SN15]EAT83509.2 hypothetical protein SNOG_09317 [Parastagonospora nodorum SN15]
MAAARRHSSVQIFQDPVLPHDHHPSSQLDPRYPDQFVSVTDVSSDSHTLLAPPASFIDAHSPRKTRHVSSSPPPQALAEKGINGISIPPPMEHQWTDAPLKKTFTSHPEQPHSMTSMQYWNTYPAGMDKENVYSYPDPPMSAMAAAAPPIKHSLKRSFSDVVPAAPLRDRSKKQKTKEVKVEEAEGPLPEPDEMPAVEDDGAKPSYSYAMLIGMAILRAPARRLTLAQIYKWISDTFAFYRNSQETGWQNSIRHNLSLSKSFSKQERPKDDPGKGHYWVINSGFEKQYHKVKPVRRPAQPESFMSAYPGEFPRPNTSASVSFPPMSSAKGFDSSKFPEEPELPSSDATIPNSDPAAHDGHDPLSMPPPRQIPSSPPPADIHSSPPPPISRSRSAREDTPPRAPRLHSNSRSLGGRKRKFNGLGDSGYYSSIESSATKGQALGTPAHLRKLISIVRSSAVVLKRKLRGSPRLITYDSPTKTRPFMKQPSNGSLMSSPFRSNPKLGGPLTPAVVSSVQLFRCFGLAQIPTCATIATRCESSLASSPDKSLDIPAVQIPNEEHVNLVGSGFDNTFDIFGDFPYNESPIKRSAKRPRLVLADITGAKANVNSPTPNWKMASSFLNIPNLSPIKGLSPLKAPQLKSSTSNLAHGFSLPGPGKENGQASMSSAKSFGATSTQQNQHQQEDDDIFHLLHSDESEPGIDLLQGFEKIGARPSAVAANGSPQKVSGRPGLARSTTSRF